MTVVRILIFPHQTGASLSSKHMWEDDQVWEIVSQASPPLGHPLLVDTLTIFGQYILIGLPQHYFIG